ncbi:hypothetical protein X801_05644 [Opisthorchis viverrini]|uniref:Uncharacterized protein n=1 Tax=Opisthorchis viverrini TaxID=6198 RepID=A0A1S8WVU2_OPIVI|nr:hypothetical protein X801_05644 [Opisthorchis viverrini]
MAVRKGKLAPFLLVGVNLTRKVLSRNSLLMILSSFSTPVKDLCNLIKYILRKFFEAQQQNNGVLIELLFFKTVKEGFEMVKGYGTFEDSKKSVKWNAELDGELIKLFEAYRNDPVPRGLQSTLPYFMQNKSCYGLVCRVIRTAWPCVVQAVCDVV